MKKIADMNLKRLAIILAAVLLVLVVLLWFFACKNDSGGNGGEASETRETPVTDPAVLEEQRLEEMSMAGKMESWRGQGDTGRVDLPGSWEATVINNAAELAPYRAFFPGLTDADASRITADADGIVAVLEIASPDLTLNYGVNEVTREGDQIFFLVSASPDLVEDETPEYDGEEYVIPGSPYEYFLFYIPGEHYNNESLQFSFLN